MSVTLSPVGGVAAQFFSNDGVPLAGGLIYTYLAGTNTPAATYTSTAGSIAHSNPIVLDSAGRVPSGEIWLNDAVVYKFVLKDASNVLIATYDNITGINSNFVNYINQQEIQTATAGQTVFTLTTMTYLPGSNSLSVFVDGVNQYGPGAQYAYVETSAATITFASGLHVGALVKFTTTQQQSAGVIDASQVSYDPPFTGSVPTNVEAKLAQIVSVKDFGAVGDGAADDTAAIQAANDAVHTAGGGQVYFPAGTYKTTAQINRSVGVSFIGAGRSNTKLDARHNGPIVRCFNTLLPAIQDDNYSEVSGLWFSTGGGFTPSYGLVYRCLGFTRVENCRFDAAILNGIWGQFILNSRFVNLNIESATGVSLYSTGVADGCNLNVFDEVAFANNATCALLIEGHGSYQNEFRTCSFFTAATTSIDHIYACKTRFVNCTWEANLTHPVKLRGGDGISFIDCSQIDPNTFIDAATFGATNVIFERPLLWNTDTVTPSLLSAEQITLRDPVYTLDEPLSVSDQEEYHLTSIRHSTGNQFAHFPGYANFSSSHANSHVTPFGGVIKPNAYNRVGSWNFADVGQWSPAGTSGATDPFGGTTAYNMNSINSNHGGFSLGSAATGRTFTFQVWAKFIGRVRLGIGTTVGGIKKFANFYSSYSDWLLLSVTYTSGTDTGTIPFMNILTDQAAVLWRPCHYENLGPLPAIQPARNLAGIVTPMTVDNTQIVTYSNAAPTANTWAIGDAVRQTVPVVGQPKGWRCTAGGTPGTWVSEGNL
jgi:hypothetical protein